MCCLTVLRPASSSRFINLLSTRLSPKQKAARLQYSSFFNRLEARMGGLAPAVTVPRTKAGRTEGFVKKYLAAAKAILQRDYKYCFEEPPSAGKESGQKRKRATWTWSLATWSKMTKPSFAKKSKHQSDRDAAGVNQ